MSNDLGTKISYMAFALLGIVALAFVSTCIVSIRAEDTTEPNIEDLLCNWERDYSIPAIIADREAAGVLLRSRTISGDLLKAMHRGNRNSAFPRYDVALLIERKDGTGEFLRGLGIQLCGGVQIEAFELTKMKITLKNLIPSKPIKKKIRKAKRREAKPRRPARRVKAPLVQSVQPVERQ